MAKITRFPSALISGDCSILTDGKIDIKKLNPVAWDASSLNYMTLGDSVGTAWNSGMVLKEK